MKIPISLLSTFLFCPYKAYLEYLGYEGEETIELVKGRKWHELLEERHKRLSNMKISIKEALKISKEEGKIIIFREVPVEEEILYGRIDEVWISPVSIVVIDDKPKISEGYKIQVIGYAYTFLKMFKCKRPIIACIRKRENRVPIWHEPLERKHVEKLKRIINRLILFLNGEFNGYKADFRKCLKCNMRKICPFRHSNL